MALAYHKQLNGGSSFAIWKIEETAEQLYSQLQLKNHETEYLNTLINGKRNLHWLSTRVLLRTMLNTDEYIDCQIDEHGKPYLTNFPHHISLSHSYDYAAVMISKNSPVGIDIELIKNKIERVARKFMSLAEMDFINPDHRIEHLYICWCAKEAVYKMYGKKNISFLENIKLSPFEWADSGSFPASLNAESKDHPYLVHFQKFNNYMVGLVDGDEI